MPLPTLGSPEWDAEVKFYLKSSQLQRDQRAKDLGYCDRATYQNAMLRRGIRLKGQNNIIAPPEPQVLPAPDLKIKPFLIAKQTRDEEDIIIILSDHHPGRKTESYNINIYKRRIDELLDNTMRIINLHRPIRRLFVFALGDLIHGESIYKGARIEECEMGAYGQVYDCALPILSSFLVSLSQGVKSIEFHGVRGNHGRYDRTAVPRTNWDNFLYRALEQYLKNQKNITIHYTTEFYKLVTIHGFRFFLVHGDQVRANQGIPLFALRRKFQEWFAYVGGFNYAYCGHWHCEAKDAINSVSDYTICPPLVTGDAWALEVVGRASKPVQLCCGVHPRFGRTFEYNIWSDKAFLPVPFSEKEIKSSVPQG